MLRYTTGKYLVRTIKSEETSGSGNSKLEILPIDLFCSNALSMASTAIHHLRYLACYPSICFRFFFFFKQIYLLNQGLVSEICQSPIAHALKTGTDS